MATAKKTEDINNVANEKVTIVVQKIIGFKEDDLIVSLNGKVYQIMRGEPVSVPRAVAEIISESERLEVIADDFKKSKAE